jgi:hypothetical protein
MAPGVHRITFRTGAAAVLLAGLAWAAFCLQLAGDAHAPSRVLVPIARQDYYRAQALFVVPVLFVSWALCAVVSAWVARGARGAGAGAPSAGPIGVALAAPLLVLFLGPDAVAYALHGFGALGKVVRVTAPLALVATIALIARVLRATHQVSRRRAWAAAAAGVIAQALLGAPLLR